MTEVDFDHAKWAASFGKKEVLCEVSNKGVLKALFRPSFSDTCSATRRTARDVLFRLLGYQRVLSRFAVANDMDLSKKKEKIAQR